MIDYLHPSSPSLFLFLSFPLPLFSSSSLFSSLSTLSFPSLLSPLFPPSPPSPPSLPHLAVLH